MTTRTRAPACLSLLVLFVLGCSSSSSSSSSSGCSNTTSVKSCDIDTTATVCGDQITINCIGGATPDAKSQCQKAISQGDQAIYCCTSAVMKTEDDAEDLGVGGDGGAGGTGIDT